jgi:hypothetical protein
MVIKFYSFLFIVAILSIVLGFSYINDLWFTWDFLGPEKGSEVESVALWGYLSNALGFALLSVTVMLRIRNHKSLYYLLIAILTIITLIQLPAILLYWLLSLPSIEGIRGLLTHFAMILFVFLFLYSFQKSKLAITEPERRNGSQS